MFLQFGLLGILSFVVPGFCIDCFRCNSTGSLDCLEKFMHPNPLRPQSCADVYEAKYCIKTTGIHMNELGTQRFCSQKDMGNECHFIDYKNRTYKGCIYTCSTDGCNGATQPTHHHLCLLVALVSAAAIVVTRRLIS